MTATIGRPFERLDGPLKVTGTARYCAEMPLPGLVHAVIIGAEVPSGRITGIDTSAAEKINGVLAVLSHLNLPKVAVAPKLFNSFAGNSAPGQSFFPMQDDVVHYAGQHVAIVIAETLDQAEYAASIVDISYERTASLTTIEEGRDRSYVPRMILGGLLPGRLGRGDIDAGLARATVLVDRTYYLAANHHNPIEPSNTIAYWERGKLVLHDATQGPIATQLTVAQLLGLPPSNVRVLTEFVGGSFGSKAMIWDHPTLAALAARHVGRPVKLVLTREQMFSSCGHREEQEHHLTLGATDDGRLTALRHHKLSPTSHFDDWAEPSLDTAAGTYACENYEGVYNLIHANTITPTFMRAPGDASGMHALECAMDELAYATGLDPLELRLRNHADVDPVSGNPWSSKGLKECYQRGAELFGWSGRDPTPGSRRDGHWLIGTGMATAAYPVHLPVNPQRARARLYADGSAVIQASVSEFGTGVATAMTQVAADTLGIAYERVRFEGGDSDLPNIAAAVASGGTGAVSAAVYNATRALRDQLVAQAVADSGSPLHGADPGKVVVQDGRMSVSDRPDVGETYTALLQRNYMPDADALGTWNPPPLTTPHGLLTFGAQFAEVGVDMDLGLIRLRRMVGVFAPGRVLNRRLAHSQLMGSLLWGMSQALLEGTLMDSRVGKWANASLADYLVPVNADVPEIIVDTVEVEDKVVNPLGVKGAGEIGVVSAAAAIANAVYHATGRRVHHLPIRIEDML
jgi:xanthine dehydrogenase YagR molybdenum-binding subunit